MWIGMKTKLYPPVMSSSLENVFLLHVKLFFHFYFHETGLSMIFCETIFGPLTRNIQIYDTPEKYVYLNFFMAF